jgi:hypothetical protein
MVLSSINYLQIYLPGSWAGSKILTLSAVTVFNLMSPLLRKRERLSRLLAKSAFFLSCICILLNVCLNQLCQYLRLIVVNHVPGIVYDH